MEEIYFRFFLKRSLIQNYMLTLFIEISTSLLISISSVTFIILETINHMLEQGSKIFSCFLDVRKAFDTVWTDSLLFKLFTELGINGKMWLEIKDLYTNVKARVLYSGSLSRMFGISQGTGRGEF